ncbi:NLRC3, partial [Symbiodinium necroappetens]
DAALKLGDLGDPNHLREVLLTSNTRLVRAEYLWHLLKAWAVERVVIRGRENLRPLCQEGETLPRRQEAEDATFPTGDGSTTSALVSRDELEHWCTEEDAFIMAVSHCWETKLHPDPTNHQLQLIADFTSLHCAAYGRPVWLFYDYVCLFQYPRDDGQERHFREALANMHTFYAHECTYTLRVQSLSPMTRWTQHLSSGKKIIVYDEQGQKSQATLGQLNKNEVPYEERGWCQSEMEWSSTRARIAQNQRIDTVRGLQTGAKSPTPPELFEQMMIEKGLKFTNKEDLDKVIMLQRKVYQQKARAQVGF